jgi:hypothetical protein
VTGPMKSPPGGTAKNWGRRDNIRAGSVSGPWRSSPREDGASGSPDGPSEPIPRAELQLRRSGTVSTGVSQEKPAGPAPAASRSSAPPIRSSEPPAGQPSDAPRLSGRAESRRPAGSPARGRVTLLPAILGGTLVALAIVGGAIYLRAEISRTDIPAAGTRQERAVPGDATAPASQTGQAVPDGEGQPRAEEAATPATIPEVATGREAPGGRAVPNAAESTAATSAVPLRLRIGEGFPEEERLALVAQLEAAGHDRVLVEEIPFPIALSRVGYYQAGDRSAALALAEEIAPFIEPENGEVVVRDYGNLVPDAEPGRLDLWVKTP